VVDLFTPAATYPDVFVALYSNCGRQRRNALAAAEARRGRAADATQRGPAPVRHPDGSRSWAGTRSCSPTAHNVAGVSCAMYHGLPALRTLVVGMLGGIPARC
jgi:hypothetical protein